MKKTGVLCAVLILTFAFFSCNSNNKMENIETWKKEIADTEKAFAEMAAKEGIKKAFLYRYAFIYIIPVHKFLEL